MSRALVVVVMLFAAGFARGQVEGGAGVDDGVAPAGELAERLERLEARIEAERASLAEMRAEHKRALAGRREQRSELAGEAVALERQRQRLAGELAELEPKVERAAERRAEAASAWGRVERSVDVLADQVEVYASELPGRSGAVERVREAVAAIGEGQVASGYAQLAEVIDQLDGEAQTITLESVELRTAGGRVEEVELLSVGHVGFAYRVGERIGLAFASPEDATGRRWREDLPAGLIERWRGVFGEVRGVVGGDGSGALIDVPMDPTGRIRAEAAVAREGLADRFRAGGPVMWPLAVVAALCVLLLLERGWTLYVRNGSDPSLARRAVAAVRQGEAERALEMARRRNNSVGRTLVALLNRRGAGQHAMEDSVQEQLLYEMPRLQRFLRGIGILAAVAPLLGLLGTVTGIIETFNVIRTVGNTAPSMMAGGISQALLTTATGLSIAIPVLLVNGVMRGRVDRILAEAEEQAATMLNVLTHDRAGADREGEGKGKGQGEAGGRGEAGDA